MKKMKKITIFIIAALTTLSSFSQDKLGHIDVQEILVVMPEYKAAETEMQNFALDLEKTSKAAPKINPSFKAFSNSSSLMIPPLAVLIIIEFFFIVFNTE